MNEELAIILETASKIFNKHVNHDLRQFIDKENINLINLWNDIEEQGLSKIIVKEKFNGSGLPFSFILPLIKISNNFLTQTRDMPNLVKIWTSQMLFLVCTL